MKVIKMGLVAALAALAFSAQADVHPSLELGVGYAEASQNGPSDHDTQFTAAFTLAADSGIWGRLSYRDVSFDDAVFQVSSSGVDTSFLNLAGGYRLAVGERLGLSGAVLLESIHFNSDSDEAYGGQLGADLALTNGLDLRAELGYQTVNDLDADLLTATVAATITLAEQFSIGLQYWNRVWDIDGQDDLDQEAMSVMLGLQF